jgi:flagellin-specific chaperone FliS
MPQDTDIQRIQELQENQRKMFKHARALVKRIDEAKNTGQLIKANAIYSELTNVYNNLERLKAQLKRFCTVMQKRADRAKQRKQLQHIMN